MNRFLLLVLVVWTTTIAFAARSEPLDLREQARHHYARGIANLERGDVEGGLAELQAAHALVPSAAALYNMALAYSELGHPVEALQALEAGARLGYGDPELANRANRLRDEQKALVGTVRIRVASSSGAKIQDYRVEADSITCPHADGELTVRAGLRIIGVTAAKHTPMRKQVVVPAGGETALEFALEPNDQDWAHLTIDTPIPDAIVRFDGTPIGRTPLSGPLSVPAGKHLVELERPGFVTARRSVTLVPRGDHTVHLQLEVSPLGAETGTLTNTGRLVLALNEPRVLVFVNSRLVGPYQAPLRLPPGQHRIRLERSGFYPLERPVNVPAGGEVRLNLWLEPTSETREAHQRAVRRKRRWGIGTVVGGGIVSVATVSFLAMNQQALNTRQAALDEHLRETGHCDSRTSNVIECERTAQDLLDERDMLHTRQSIGYVTLGAGLLGTAAGSGLLIWGPRGDRFDPPSRQEARVRLVVTRNRATIVGSF